MYFPPKWIWSFHAHTHTDTRSHSHAHIGKRLRYSNQHITFNPMRLCKYSITANRSGSRSVPVVCIVIYLYMQTYGEHTTKYVHTLRKCVQRLIVCVGKSSSIERVSAQLADCLPACWYICVRSRGSIQPNWNGAWVCTCVHSIRIYLCASISLALCILFMLHLRSSNENGDVNKWK